MEEHVASQLEKMRAKPDAIFPSVDALVDAARQGLGDWWNEYVEAMERYGAYKVDEGKYRKSFSRQASADYMRHYFHCRFEEYYKRVKCPLLMVSGEDVLENEREKAAMEGLSGLAEQAQIVTVSGWVHPYGWLLDPEGMCHVILEFLGDTASEKQGL